MKKKVNQISSVLKLLEKSNIEFKIKHDGILANSFGILDMIRTIGREVNEIANRYNLYIIDN